MSSGSRAAAAVLLVAAAGPAGFFLYRFLAAEHLIAAPAAHVVASESRQPAAESRQPAAESRQSASESHQAAAGDSAAAAVTHEATPEELPAITLPDAKGTPRSLSSWIGHPLVINFWATWCEPCRREIPLLQTLRRRARDHLEIVGIAVDDRDAALQYVRRMSIDYPVLAGGESAGLAAVNAFGVQAAVLPLSVFADGRGRIVAVKVGEIHPDDAQLILARLADVDSGRLALQSAREQISAGLAALAAARARGTAGNGTSATPQPPTT